MKPSEGQSIPASTSPFDVLFFGWTSVKDVA